MDPNTLFLLVIGGAAAWAVFQRFRRPRATAAPDLDRRGAPSAHRGAVEQGSAPPEIPSWLGAAPRRTSVAQVRLSALARLDNVAIVGPKGSGKTTILRTLAGLRRGELVAFDPDNSPGKWPAITFGGGSRFEQIAFAFTRLDSAMRARSEDLDAGRVADEAFPLRTLVSDESMLSARSSKRASAAIKTSLTSAPCCFAVLCVGANIAIVCCAQPIMTRYWHSVCQMAPLI
jgi:hypothetical protein